VDLTGVEHDGRLTSVLRTALAVLLPPALVVTLWVIGWLHASGERRVAFPPLNPPLAHLAAADDDPDPWRAPGADDAPEARLDLTDDLGP
jgi:hypothetical protein